MDFNSNKPTKQTLMGKLQEAYNARKLSDKDYKLWMQVYDAIGEKNPSNFSDFRPPKRKRRSDRL